MPELPEVEIMVRDLARWADDNPLDALHLDDPRLLHRGELPDLPRRVTAIRRRAKLALIELGALTLAVHFRMTGKLVLLGDAPRRFVRARLVFGDRQVAFVDPRCLGTFDVLDAGQLAAELEHLGPDVWPQRCDGAWLAGRLAGSRGAVKPALLQQRRLGGVGNIGASEACSRAGVDPRTPCAALSPEQLRALARGLWEWADETVRVESGGELRLIGEAGAADNHFGVYGREGQPCPRCGGRIARLVQSGRATFWCPGCQG